MARYYLHVKEFNGDLIEDDEGSEFPSLAAAKADAIEGMQDTVADAIRRGAEPKLEAIVIADEQGAYLAAVPLVAALPSTVVGLLKYPDKVLPADRLEEYRRNADQCRTKAEDTDDADDKMSWLKLADAWLQMLPPTQSSGGDLAGWPKASEANSKASH